MVESKKERARALVAAPVLDLSFSILTLTTISRTRRSARSSRIYMSKPTLIPVSWL